MNPINGVFEEKKIQCEKRYKKTKFMELILKKKKTKTKQLLKHLKIKCGFCHPINHCIANKIYERNKNLDQDFEQHNN